MRTSVRVVDREQLERWLDEGVSVEEIARRVGKHPSTVAYWMRKHGVRSVQAERHAAARRAPTAGTRGALGARSDRPRDRGTSRPQPDHCAVLAPAPRAADDD